jgi:hypothetical protein
VKQQLTVEKALAIGEKAYKCGYEECGRLYTTLHHLKVCVCAGMRFVTSGAYGYAHVTYIIGHECSVKEKIIA